MPLTPLTLWTSRVLRVVVAAILLQTLFFKFTGAPESVLIFRTLGMEPWGRWGSGVAEAIASVLLFWPSLQAVGALLVLAVMSGALTAHLTRLGIPVAGDGGLLFALALAAWLGAAAVLWMHRKSLPVLGRHLPGGESGGGPRAPMWLRYAACGGDSATVCQTGLRVVRRPYREAGRRGAGLPYQVLGLADDWMAAGAF